MQTHTSKFKQQDGSGQKVRNSTKIIASRGKSSEVESNYENKILVQYKENSELDDELKVINKIYDRFYNSQKPPNKKVNNQFKTKFYKYIPRDPLFKDYSVYINKQSFLEKKKITDYQYKQRHKMKQRHYFNLLNSKIRGDVPKSQDDEFSKKMTNPAFKYLGLGYKDSNDMSMLAAVEALNAPDEFIPPSAENNDNSKIDQNLDETNRADEKQKSRRIGSLNYNRFQHLYQFDNSSSSIGKFIILRK